jgi:cell wall-associated NlpC family hydrolase
MVLTYAYCHVSQAPVRNEPRHGAEMVTELLFGERVEILEINDKDWAKIRVEWDGYIGWCKYGQLCVVTYKEYKKQAKYLVGNHTSKFIINDSEQHVPLGADLYGMKGGKIHLYQKTAKYKGKKSTIKALSFNCDDLKEAAMKYLNAPYLWGGRTIAGIDCSGLVQMAFKLCGTRISRDASMQAEEGTTVDFLQNAKCGDLAFFDNEVGKITHVGILLDNATIIHATDTSGRVVIDKIDQGGIISVSLRKRTHNLRVVKRVIPD